MAPIGGDDEGASAADWLSALLAGLPDDRLTEIEEPLFVHEKGLTDGISPLDAAFSQRNKPRPTPLGAIT